MAAEGRNLLEVVLNTDIAKKFNAVDDAVDKIQASMNSAAESAKQFAEALDGINKSFGDKSGFASFAENIQKLIESLNGLNANTGAKGIEQTKKGIESIGEAAILDIDSVQKLIDAINKIPEAFSKTSSGSSSSGGSKKSNVLDGLLFDTKDLQAKREELAALLAEFETKIKSIGGKFFDVGQLIGTGGIDSAKRLQSVIENLQKSIANTQVDLENTTKRFFSGSFEGKYKEFEKMDAAYIRLQNRLNDLQQKLQSAETLAPLLKEFKAIREEYLQTTADLNTFVQKNNKITEAQKTIEGYKKELEGMANAFERMKASGKAFTSKGGLTDEAQKLLAEKQALEEKLRLYQMSADEAIKQEQRKNAEIEKEEKAASQRLKALYDERLKLEQAIFETRQKANTSQSSDSSYYENLSKLAKNYDDRIKEIDRDIKEIEGDYARAGIEARNAYDTKSIKQAIEQEEKREKAIDKTIKSIEKLKETERKQSEEERNNKIGLLSGDAPRTIREYEIAIKNLRNEIKNLDVETQKGQINEYNKRITEYKKKVDDATGATNRFRQENIKLNNVLQQVAGAFGVYLGVQGIVNFVRNVAKTTGEFEMQHRAMQALIQDTNKANQLWEKTIALAVKSPYRVKDLVSYTKQLAAYRIETDKLYDTTKMLADISAGLGVDMQRLILAYGQVKAANYLRGQELRQFSEAGVNILGELANYFSELKGRAISTGEVFDMVSKRMVKFEDVANVLKRLTQEGGTFFNMQEIQAETLQGKFANLKDSFDIMLNSIGESNRGFLTWFVDTARKVIDNWEAIATTLKAVGGIIGAIAIASRAMRIEMEATLLVEKGTAITLRGLSGVMARYIAATKGATIATKGFSAAMKSIPIWGWILAALSAVAGAILSIANASNKAKEELKEFNSQTEDIRARITETKSYSDALIKLSEEQKELNSVKDKSADQEKRLKEIEDERKTVLTELIKINPQYGKSLQDIKTDTEKLIEKEKEELSTLRALLGVRQILSGKDFVNNVEAYNEAYSAMQNTAAGIEMERKSISSYIGTINEANEVQSRFLDSFNEEQKRILQSIGLWNRLVEAVNNFTTNPNGFDLQTNLQSLGSELAGILNMLDYRNKKSPLSLSAPDAPIYSSIKENFDAAIGRLYDLNTAQNKVAETRVKLDKDLIKGIEGYAQSTSFLNIQKAIDEATSDKEKEIARQKFIKFWIDALDTSRLNISARERAKQLIIEKLGKDIGVMRLELPFVTQTDDTFDKGGANKALQLLNKQIEAIKNAAKQYDEYKKMYDDTTAYQKTKNEVSGLFDELNIGKILNDASDFDPTTIKDNLTRWLAPSIAAAGKAGQQAAEKYKSGLQLEFDKAEYAKNIVDKFKKDLNDAFDQLSLGDELSKLGLGRDFTKILFGVDTQSTEEIRDFVNRWKSQLQGSGKFGETAEKEYKAAMEKIDDMEDKAQKERLKKYVAYTKQAMTERAKIEVEGLQELAEIEKTFQKEIEKAEGEGNTARAEQLKKLMETAIAGSTRATEEKLGKQAWDDFKGSDLYIEMFDDLGNVSTKVINTIQEKIRQLRGSLKGLNPSDLKAITQEMNKLEDELVRRNPFQGFVDAWKKVKALQKEGKTEESLSQRMIGNQEDIEMYDNLIVANEKLLEVRSKWNQEQIDQSGGTTAFLAQNNLLQTQINKWNELIKKKKQDNAVTAQELDDYQDFQKAAKAYADYLQSMGSRVASVFSDIMSNLEAFGGTTTETTKAWGDMGEAIMSIAAMIPSYILLMEAAGVAAKTAFGPIGWIMMAVEALVAIIKGIANIRNAAIDDEIERYKKQVDDLSDKYDRLEKKFDSVWDINRLRQYNSDMRSYMEQQIGYYEKMIKAEESRKSPDQSVIDEYNKQINDLYDQMEERHDEWLEKVSGFGGESSWGDATQGFIDAWYDAFAETGDGLEGLKENFNEVIVNMVKKQAALRLANAILEPLYKKINEAANDGTITNSEMDAIVAKANATFPELNEKLKAFFQSLGVFGEQAAGELDGLQKGIQGVTEQTAEIIAAYMNSIRYYVIDNNTKLGQIISALQDSTGTFNPMVAELRNIRHQAEDIRNLLFSWRETSGVPSMRVTIV